MKSPGPKKNEIITREMLSDRVNQLIGEEGLNIDNGEYYYVKTVGNHLVVGRAKIILED
jgi:hypothetical protein